MLIMLMKEGGERRDDDVTRMNECEKKRKRN